MSPGLNAFCEVMGITKKTAWTYITDARKGVVRRINRVRHVLYGDPKPPRKPRNGQTPMSIEEVASAAALMRKGVSLQRTAAVLDRAPATVRHNLLRWGLLERVPGARNGERRWRPKEPA